MCKNLNLIYSGEKRDLLLRKGVYPYDWVDSIDKFLKRNYLLKSRSIPNFAMKE